MSKSLRVAAFTQGINIPSARFRVRQYRDCLFHKNIELTEYPAKFGSYPPKGFVDRVIWFGKSVAERAAAVRRAENLDIALFQREMIATLATSEFLWRKAAVLDVDDAIWIKQRFGSIDRLAGNFRHIICGNDYIAEHFDRYAPVSILPTAVDTHRFVPGKQSDEPLICWSGSSSGLVYLLEIESALLKVFSAIPRVRLRIVCDVSANFSRLPADRVEFVPWSEENEVHSIQEAWAGLMPMPDTMWTRGKCSYKMLTYMACGVPAVVSPWGMNRNVIERGGGAFGAATNSQWADILIDLLRNRERIDKSGAAGREVVMKFYSLENLGSKLANILSDCASV